MKFKNIVIENSSTRVLKKSFEKNKTHHAYLFAGPEGCGKKAAAFEFAMALLCKNRSNAPCYDCNSCRKFVNYIHPDFKYVFPFVSKEGFKNISKKFNLKERYQDQKDNKPDINDQFDIFFNEYAKKEINNPFYNDFKTDSAFTDKNMEIGIGQISELIESSYMPPNESDFKVIMIDQLEKMNVAASNSILKTLEEPPKSVRFLLVTSKPDSLLPTIRSRCQILRFSQVSDEVIKNYLMKKYGYSDNESKQAAIFAAGSIKNALLFTNPSFKKYKEDAIQIIHCITEKDMMLILSIASSFSEDDINVNIQRFTLVLFFIRYHFLSQISHNHEDFLDLKNDFQGLHNMDHNLFIDKTAKLIKCFERRCRLEPAILSYFFSLI